MVKHSSSRHPLQDSGNRIKLYGLLVPLGYDIAAFTPVAYQRGSLPRSFKEISSCGGFRAYMLSALIPSERSYPAVLLAEQPVHQRFVQLGPLVLESGPLKFLTPTTDRDRTVSRRSEPSSRATLTELSHDVLNPARVPL